MKNVMVAGGAGFVGSAVVRELLAQGCNVVCFDNYLHGSPGNVAGLDGPLAIVEGDALDESQIAATLRKHAVTHIIDCIGDTFVPSAYVFPARFFDVNVRATLNILCAARDCRVERVLYVSSTEVYGHSESRRLDERAPLLPVNTYAVSKLAADRLCHTFSIEHDLPVIVARIFNCYGPRETHPYIVPEIIRQLHRGPRLTLGNLSAERDFTYVEDTARALVGLLFARAAPAEPVNVGSDCCYSIEWLARSIGRIMGHDPIEIVSDPARFRRRDIASFRCDNTRLVKTIGWAPTVGIHDGLRRTVQWFHDNGACWSWSVESRDVAVETAPAAAGIHRGLRAVTWR
jgi:nucleoside-diphosphate-sugar epimerase